MKAAALLLLALLAGCSSTPMVDGGGITCVRVDALTTSTTTVYIPPGLTGSVMVLPNCMVRADLLPKGMGL